MTPLPVVRTERRLVADLVPAAYNPRTISAEALRGLRASVETFGCVQPIVVNDRTGNVIGGHQRLRVLLEIGETSTQGAVVDLPAGREKALNVALNNPHTSGEFDETLDALLASCPPVPE